MGLQMGNDFKHSAKLVMKRLKYNKVSVMERSSCPNLKLIENSGL